MVTFEEWLSSLMIRYSLSRLEGEFDASGDRASLVALPVVQDLPSIDGAEPYHAVTVAAFQLCQRWSDEHRLRCDASICISRPALVIDDSWLTQSYPFPTLYVQFSREEREFSPGLFVGATKSDMLPAAPVGNQASLLNCEIYRCGSESDGMWVFWQLQGGNAVLARARARYMQASPEERQRLMAKLSYYLSVCAGEHDAAEFDGPRGPHAQHEVVATIHQIQERVAAQLVVELSGGTADVRLLTDLEQLACRGGCEHELACSCEYALCMCCP